MGETWQNTRSVNIDYVKSYGRLVVDGGDMAEHSVCRHRLCEVIL